MAKLNRDQIQVLTETIQNKIGESKMKSLEKKVSGDNEFKKLEKLVEKRNQLNEQVNLIGNEINSLTQILRIKYSLNINYYGKGVNFSFYDSDLYKKIHTEITLKTIGKDFDVEKFIDKMVKEYSK